MYLVRESVKIYRKIILMGSAGCQTAIIPTGSDIPGSVLVAQVDEVGQRIAEERQFRRQGPLGVPGGIVRADVAVQHSEVTFRDRLRGRPRWGFGRTVNPNG